MKICYLGYLRIPTEKAHGFQIMKMCEAFALLGHEVELVTPKRKNELTEDPFAYYGVPPSSFLIRQIDVGSFDLYHTRKWVIWVKNMYYSGVFLLHLRRMKFTDGTLVYTRNATIAGWIGVCFPDIPVAYEAHGVPMYFSLHRFLLGRVRMVVAITQGIVDGYRGRGYKGKIVVEADAVDLSVFANMKDQRSVRTELGLPLDSSIAVYTGSFSLYSWKGVDVLIESVKYLPKDVLVVLVGGSEEEIKNMSASVSSRNLLFVPRVSREVVARYLCAADVLVLPNTKGDLASERYTSPLKLFEYMASGTPIVASDLPSIREVLDEKLAVLVSPNDPKALADGIKQIIAHPAQAEFCAQRAREKVTPHTWVLRAERVCNMVVS